MAEEIEAQGTIQRVEEVTDEEQRKTLRVKIDSWTYTLYKTSLFGQWKGKKGIAVKFRYKVAGEGGRFRNMNEESPEFLGPAAPPAAVPGAASPLTPEQTAERDRLQCRESIAVALIHSRGPVHEDPLVEADIWRDWVYETAHPVSKERQARLADSCKKLGWGKNELRDHLEDHFRRTAVGQLSDRQQERLEHQLADLVAAKEK
jgi:hypothetical protein